MTVYVKSYHQEVGDVVQAPTDRLESLQKVCGRNDTPSRYVFVRWREGSPVATFIPRDLVAQLRLGREP